MSSSTSLSLLSPNLSQTCFGKVKERIEQDYDLCEIEATASFSVENAPIEELDFTDGRGHIHRKQTATGRTFRECNVFTPIKTNHSQALLENQGSVTADSDEKESRQVLDLTNQGESRLSKKVSSTLDLIKKTFSGFGQHIQTQLATCPDAEYHLQQISVRFRFQNNKNREFIEDTISTQYTHRE
ncbi:MAG: hypothetical protein K940chlam7_02120 [Chlamydiae bacterium]|nr:hypothetical protein [Chlamydiota bacterium]